MGLLVFSIYDILNNFIKAEEGCRVPLFCFYFFNDRLIFRKPEGSRFGVVLGELKTNPPPDDNGISGSAKVNMDLFGSYQRLNKNWRSFLSYAKLHSISFY
jgi:hypothetical protein